ncbi:XRE family transcriptional regulator [Flavobacterium sp. LS1P28]|uniref:helix-turn-helix domain-containing protein n=1 Tax=unclassified Flavobacterium TaxID=196869 RepID=UPI000F81EA9C|nr:XRE family transcriptional regulator [Flavobacterium sp. LS1R10]RTY79202.1 XRE family transcriptional regulator [Flavobacterium sp. LS1P28]
MVRYFRRHINIKKIRELKNLTRDFVAAELEMSTSGYGKIERGEIDLTISRVVQIAEVLSVSVFDILFFDAEIFFIKDNIPIEVNISKNYVERKKYTIPNIRIKC